MAAKASKHQNVPAMTRISRILPIFQWLPAYQKESLRPDITAGLTLAAFTIPEAIAYAELAGLPATAGLYAAIAAPILYMLFGTSRQLAVGPTSAVSVPRSLRAGKARDLLSGPLRCSGGYDSGPRRNNGPGFLRGQVGLSRQFHFGVGPGGLFDRGRGVYRLHSAQ